jgi:hypothetical protein
MSVCLQFLHKAFFSTLCLAGFHSVVPYCQFVVVFLFQCSVGSFFVIVTVFSVSGINHFSSIAFILLRLNPFHTQHIFKMQTTNGLMGLDVKHAP